MRVLHPWTHYPQRILAASGCSEPQPGLSERGEHQALRPLQDLHGTLLMPNQENDAEEEFPQQRRPEGFEFAALKAKRQKSRLTNREVI